MPHINETVEKVELTEDLIATYESGIEPTTEALVRASELGIDVERMREVYGDATDY